MSFNVLKSELFGADEAPELVIVISFLLLF